MQVSGLLFLALLSKTALASVATGGNYDLIRSVHGFDFATSTGADISVTFSMGDPYDALSTMTAGGADAVLSGYLSQIPSNSMSAGTVALSSAAGASDPDMAACPVVVAGVCYGVQPGVGFPMKFSNDMSLAGMAAAVKVTAIRDSLGGLIQSTWTASMQYLSNSQSVGVLANPGNWPKGMVFSVVITTDAKDINGLALGGQSTYYFYTVKDHQQKNVAAVFSDPQVKISIPPNSFDSDFIIVMTTGVSTYTVAQADSKMKATLGADHVNLKTVEIDPYNSLGKAWSTLLNENVNLQMPFSDHNGLVAGTNPPVRSKDLSIWRLDEPHQLWVRQPNESLDTAGQNLQLATRHFSIYSLIGQQSDDVSDVYAFPVPFRPSAGNINRYGSWSTGITFTNLPSSGVIRIYTVNGLLVRELGIASNPQIWDVKNSIGQTVASGVYIWEVLVGTNRKTGKLVVIR